jgi:tRNA threonylcarbamoyladenosine biosynthesis protein TsaE
MNQSFSLKNEQATLDLGKKLARILPPKALVFLNGPLGAGKTTLVRGLLLALGHTGSTKSPTYTIVEPYQLENHKVYHFDLYRLADPEELEYMGFRDYLDERAVCLVEWPEKGQGFMPMPDLSLFLDYNAEQRVVRLEYTDTQVGKVLQEALNHLS